MDDQLFHPIIPEGMHLANPHDDPNAFLGALFDEGNHLYGQARWELADAGDEDNDDVGRGRSHRCRSGRNRGLFGKERESQRYMGQDRRTLVEAYRGTCCEWNKSQIDPFEE